MNIILFIVIIIKSVFSPDKFLFVITPFISLIIWIIFQSNIIYIFSRRDCVEL